MKWRIIRIFVHNKLTIHNMNKFISAICCGLVATFVASCGKEKDVEVSSVTLSQNSAEMYIGETTQLSAKVLPNDATDKEVTWASSKLSVATVSNTGLVTALAEGNSTITASAGGKSATCTITVSRKVIPVSSVELSKYNLSLTVGDTETLIATVKPDDATDKDIFWSSSDNSVASVDKGKVTALKEGSVNITAKAGDKQAVCSVIIQKNVIAVTSITLNKNELSLTKNSSETLVATVYPEDATDKSVTWSSSDSYVASVTQEGKVTAVGAGSATIIAKAGDQSATCAITVTVPVESVSLDNANLTLEEGQNAKLIATVAPSDATDKTVNWSSSNPEIASVNQEGEVSAIKEGSAVITATASGKEAKCDVTVKQKSIPVTSITLNTESLALNKGESETLVATVKPDNATDKTVIWTSSKPVVATVDESGKVTAAAGGETIITATAGNCSATCSVKVTVPVEAIALNTGEITLEVGESSVLSATVYPLDATDKSVEWKSSDAGVASVDQDGKVVAIHTGKTNITARAGAEEATCKVTVVRAAESIADISMLDDGTQVGTNPVLVVAKTVDGLLLSEEGHCIYLQSDYAPALVGDIIKVRGTKLTTRGLPILSGSGFFEILSTGNPVNYPTATDITDVSGIATGIFPYNDYNYASVTATLIEVRVDEMNHATYYLKFHNIDASVHDIHLLLPYAYQNYSDYVVGDEIRVYGYLSGFNYGNHSLIIIPTSMERLKTVPEGAVDLGLSVFWGDQNIGASSNSSVGDYFSWGEVESKDYYGWNYKWAKDTQNGFTKYNTRPEYGPVDNLTRLEPEDDVVYQRKGGRWRMPTEAEIRELIDNCDIEFVADYNNTGVGGFKFKSRVSGYTDKWIFIPKCGAMAYDYVNNAEWWGTINSSEMNASEPFSHIYLSLHKKTQSPYYEVTIEKNDTGMGRLAGHQVRGVYAY